MEERSASPDAQTLNAFPTREALRFIKVEKFFQNYKRWETLGEVVDNQISDTKNEVILHFKKRNGQRCSLVVYFVEDTTIRIKFNPGKVFNTSQPKNYFKMHSSDGEKPLFQMNDYKFHFNKTEKDVIVTAQRTKGQLQDIMKVVISLEKLKISVYNFALHITPQKKRERVPYLVWQTADQPIYFVRNGPDDYAIIQSVKKTATSEFVGFGEQGGQSLTKNTAQVNYFNFDNMRYMQVYNHGPLDSRQPLYHSEPIFFQYNRTPDKDNVTAIFVKNVGQILMDIGYLNSSRYMFGTRFDDLDYYVFIGNETSEIIQAFTNITGRPQLKPRYVLGYHQGCYGYQTRQKAEWAVNEYRRHQIPLDGLHVDVDIQQNYRTFTIDKRKFPDPQKFFSNLRKNGVKCSTNITPVISSAPGCYEQYSTYREGIQNNFFVVDRRYLPNDPDIRWYQGYGGGNQYYMEDKSSNFNSGYPYQGGVYYGQDQHNNPLGTPGHYPDFSRPQVRQWWGRQYKYLFDSGLEMVWQDMTTPAIKEGRGDMKGFPFRLLVSSNACSQTQVPVKVPAIKAWNQYSYNLHRATYEGLRRLPGRENKRNFIIGRGSFTGSNRYAGLWAGDNASTWDFLKMNVSQCLSLGLSGVLINGQDIGGFQANGSERWASPELIIRWTVAGAFLPWFRNHYVRKGRKQFQQPFMYQQWFNQYRGGQLPQPADLYRIVLPICRHYIQLRYRLLQLFYDCMFKNLTNGMPICRPLFLNFSKDKSLFNDKQQFLSNEFCIGTDLLIAPVLQPRIYHGIDNKGRRDVYLPDSHGWYTFVDNTMPLGDRIQGGTTICDYDAGLYLNGTHISFICPMFVREGGVIPTIQLEQYVGQRNERGLPNPITINIYPGPHGSYDLFLDDGVSCSSAPRSTIWNSSTAFSGRQQIPQNGLPRDEYRHVKISHMYDSINTKLRLIKITREVDQYLPLQDYIYIALIHDPSYKGISKINLSVTQYTRSQAQDLNLQQRVHRRGCQNHPQRGDNRPAKKTTFERNIAERYGRCEQIVPNLKQTQTVSVFDLRQITGGTPQDRARRLSETNSRQNTFYYNENIRVTFIKVWDRKEYKESVLTVTYR